jgi:hypothetical protein
MSHGHAPLVILPVTLDRKKVTVAKCLDRRGYSHISGSQENPCGDGRLRPSKQGEARAQAPQLPIATNSIATPLNREHCPSHLNL